MFHFFFNDEVDGLERLIKKLERQINRNSSQYKKYIDKLFYKKPPFPAGRDNSYEEFGYDVDQIWKIIGHSLLAGDSDIFEKWVIKPLEEGKLRLVKLYENPQYYIDEFTYTDEARGITNELEKGLINQLVEILSVYKT